MRAQQQPQIRCIYVCVCVWYEECRCRCARLGGSLTPREEILVGEGKRFFVESVKLNRPRKIDSDRICFSRLSPRVYLSRAFISNKITMRCTWRMRKVTSLRKVSNVFNNCRRRRNRCKSISAHFPRSAASACSSKSHFTLSSIFNILSAKTFKQISKSYVTSCASCIFTAR